MKSPSFHALLFPPTKNYKILTNIYVLQRQHQQTLSGRRSCNTRRCLDASRRSEEASGGMKQVHPLSHLVHRTAHCDVSLQRSWSTLLTVLPPPTHSSNPNPVSSSSRLACIRFDGSLPQLSVSQKPQWPHKMTSCAVCQTRYTAIGITTGYRLQVLLTQQLRLLLLCSIVCPCWGAHCVQFNEGRVGAWCSHVLQSLPLPVIRAP